MLTSRSLPPESLRSQMGGRKSLETCWEEQAGPRGPACDAAAPLPDLSGGKKWGLFVCGHTCGCEGPTAEEPSPVPPLRSHATGWQIGYGPCVARASGSTGGEGDNNRVVS